MSRLSLIFPDLFHTDNSDRTRTQASSYLDLGPLYGHNQAQQNKVRTFKDGLLKKDAFSESRLLGQPPGVCALIIAFNRFHNYVVGEMAVINESGRFSLPRGMTPSSEGYAEAMKKRDNDLFQTGRL
jgi:linoleate 10R-lipoxygenase